jgi:hypothetical protein
MSDTTKCPTCGGIAKINHRQIDGAGNPQLIAVSDEDKDKKIGQLKKALHASIEKLDAAKERIIELEARAGAN